MFNKVLIANRGEIAGRIIRTLQPHGHRVVAVYSDADRFTRPVLDADEAVRIGPAPAAESYLDIDAIIAACQRDRRAGRPSGLRLPVGERRFRRTARGGRHRLHRARARSICAPSA